MKLHRVPRLIGSGPLCGPTAIAAVTGINVIDVLVAAHRFCDRPWTEFDWGMTDDNIVGTMALLGWRSKVFDVCGGKLPTLYALLRDAPKLIKPAIIRVTGHYIATDGAEYVCNQTDGELVPIILAPNRYRRVRSIIEVEQL